MNSPKLITQVLMQKHLKTPDVGCDDATVVTLKSLVHFAQQ